MRTTTNGENGVSAARAAELVLKAEVVLVTLLFPWPVHMKALLWKHKNVILNIAQMVCSK